MTGCGVGAPAPGASPTGPAQVQVFSGTRTEYQRAVYGCLEDAGWVITEIPSPEGTGVAVEVDGLSEPGRSEAFSEDQLACTQSLPPIPEPESDEDVQEMYSHAVARLDCLVAAGMSSAQPPSFQAYLDSFRAGTLDWDPLNTVPAEQQEAALAQCAPDPNAWW